MHPLAPVGNTVPCEVAKIVNTWKFNKSCINLNVQCITQFLLWSFAKKDVTRLLLLMFAVPLCNAKQGRVICALKMQNFSIKSHQRRAGQLWWKFTQRLSVETGNLSLRKSFFLWNNRSIKPFLMKNIYLQHLITAIKIKSFQFSLFHKHFTGK